MEENFLSDAVETKQYLTNIIGNEYKEWMPGDLVFLKTPTGSGKTTFIIHTYATWLAQNHKKILILVSRDILQQQLERELKKVYAQNVEHYRDFLLPIQVWTYQGLEERLKYNQFIPNFFSIVCDEAHYFMDDSMFNPNTGLSYNYVIDKCKQRSSTLIVISATLEHIQSIFLSDLPKKRPPAISKSETGYQLTIVFPGDTIYEYFSFAEYDELNIKYLNENGFDELITLLPQLPGKTLCFTSSKKSGQKLAEILKSKAITVDFVNADNKTEEAANVVQSLSRNQMFKSKILIATSVLDVGVSIHDKEVRNIVIDTIEKNSFLQMLGRIRTDVQSLNLFICSRSFEYFESWIEKIIMPYLDIVNELLKADENFLATKVEELRGQCNFKLPVYWHGNNVYINKFAIEKCSRLYLHCLETKDGLRTDPEFFIKKQLEWMGQEETFSLSNYISEDVREIKKKNLTLAILEKGEKALNGNLSKQEISQFLLSIKSELRDLDRSRIRSNEAVSIPRFNDICRLEDLPFCIEQIYDSNDRKQKYQLKILELNNTNISA